MTLEATIKAVLDYCDGVTDTCPTGYRQKADAYKRRNAQWYADPHGYSRALYEDWAIDRYLLINSDIPTIYARRAA